MRSTEDHAHRRLDGFINPDFFCRICSLATRRSTTWGTLKNIHLRKRAVGVNFGVNLVWGWTESFHPEQLMS